MKLKNVRINLFILLTLGSLYIQSYKTNYMQVQIKTLSIIIY